MLPHECACLAVECVHVVIAGGNVEDAVFDDRGAFERIFSAQPGAQVGHPGALEVLDVVAVDLSQRRIARVVPIAADREPFLAGRLAQVGPLLGESHRRVDHGADRNDESQANPMHRPSLRAALSLLALTRPRPRIHGRDRRRREPETQVDFWPAGVRYLSKSCRRRDSCLAAEIDPNRKPPVHFSCVAKLLIRSPRRRSAELTAAPSGQAPWRS